MTDLTALLEKVRSATGADRELDCRLSHHFDRQGIWYGSGEDSGWAPAKTVDGWDDTKWASMADEYVSPLVPCLTASIDAASALTERLLPGCFYSVSRHVGLMKRKRKDKTVTPFEAYVANHDRIGEPGYVFALSDPAPTPALAILAATLQALIAKDTQP